MLKAGYLEDWEYRETLSGCPQGGTVSPILSNIYLHKLDEFIEQELIPQYTQGTSRKDNPEYKRIQRRLAAARRQGNRAAARELGQQLRGLPSKDPMDPGYRRLRYLRYADDHLLGFTGPKAEAEQIKARLAEFLRETLGLELNQQKRAFDVNRGKAADRLRCVLSLLAVTMSSAWCLGCRRCGRGGAGSRGCGSRRRGGPPAWRCG